MEILAPDYVKENAFTLHDGVHRGPHRRDAHAGRRTCPTKRRGAFAGLIKVRDAVRETSAHAARRIAAKRRSSTRAGSSISTTIISFRASAR